jgi:uncharacterized membrane protein
MESIVHELAHYVALILELVAIVIIALGAVEALIGVARVGMRSESRRDVWLSFARWLVAGMTFQLAADVVSTSLAPTWDEIGHLAAIAGVRTFLSWFLDREIEDRDKQAKESLAAAAKGHDAVSSGRA